MRTMVTASAMKEESARSVADLFANFDSTDIPAAIGLLRRQLFVYHDVQIHVYDFADDADKASLEATKSDPRIEQLAKDLAPYVSPLNEETWRTPADSTANQFYKWKYNPAVSEAEMHSTIIVARLAHQSVQTVSDLFHEFDQTTQLPALMGTRRRQLFSLDGLYFHIQDFDDHHGGSRIENAKSDPRFVKISQDLLPYIKVFDPETWQSPSDAMATRFYYWSAKNSASRQSGVMQ